MQRITHLNNLQLEKKIDYIKHAKISPSKQFLLLGFSKNHTDDLLEAAHYWSRLHLQMSKAEKSKANRLTFPTQCLYLKFLLSLMQKTTCSKRIKFSFPVSKHMGPNNPKTPFPTFPCWGSWPDYKERTERSCHDSRTSSTLLSLWKHNPEQ